MNLFVTKPKKEQNAFFMPNIDCVFQVGEKMVTMGIIGLSRRLRRD